MINIPNDFKKNIPEYVLKVADILNGNGFEAYLVGGAVRDIVLGREPKDFDIATNALPEIMSEIFPKCITTNARFGTVLVIMESDTKERFDVEVTTYRKEAEYYSGRWPGKVEFTTEIVTDLSRRDFTINAMAIKLESNSSEELNQLLDPFGGINDINNKIIRAVGDPKERFEEDGLRSFKACRMASELGFSIEEQTFDAIKLRLTISSMISMERIRDEFIKLIKHSSKPSVGIELLRVSGLLKIFMPELLDTINVTQVEFHTDDVYTHSLKVLDIAEDSVKIAGLLHDIGKAYTKTIGKDGKEHFYGHDQVGAELSQKILQRMKFSNNEIKRIIHLIRWHMFYYPSAQWRKDNSLIEAMDVDIKNQGGWSDAAIRRFVNKVGVDYLDDLFRLRIADATANPKSLFDASEIKALEMRISRIKSQDMAIKVSDLKINGQDLINSGIESGPLIGKILNELLNQVIEDPNINNKDYLVCEAVRLSRILL